MPKSKNSAGIGHPCSKVNSKLFDEETLSLVGDAVLRRRAIIYRIVLPLFRQVNSAF